MSKAACRTRLRDLLEAHVGLIADANRYLGQIKSAIAQNDVEVLRHNLTTPDASIAAIEQLEPERRQLLVEFGFSGDCAGLEACVNWCDDESRHLGDLFSRLVGELEELQRAIQVNNLLINKGKDRIRRSIGILTGLGSAADNTYGRQGQKLEDSGRRNIAIA